MQTVICTEHNNLKDLLRNSLNDLNSLKILQKKTLKQNVDICKFYTFFWSNLDPGSSMLGPSLVRTVCPISLDSFYIVSYYKKLEPTSWTDSMHTP